MKSAVLFAFIFSALSLFSQTAVSGRIVDAATLEPLAFANIIRTNSSIGTVSNSQGYFELNAAGLEQTDSLQISFIGYQSKTVAVSVIRSQTSPISLIAISTNLNTVIIEATDVLALLKKAVERIPENYGLAHRNTSFYRLKTKNDVHYMHLSEVVMNQYHPGYGERFSKGQVKLVKSRALMDEKESHGVELGMRPNGVRSLDLISRVGSSDLLNKRGLKKHEFEITGETIYNKTLVYVIEFDQKEKLKTALYSGKLFLDKEHLAIVYIEIGYSKKGLEYATYKDPATRAALSLFGMHIGMGKEDFKIYYRKIGSRWYLHKAVNDSWLQISSRREGYKFPVFAHLEYVITETDTLNSAPFPVQELARNTILENQVTDDDPEFWANYNIILPDFSFHEIAVVIEERNKAEQR